MKKVPRRERVLLRIKKIALLCPSIFFMFGDGKDKAYARDETFQKVGVGRKPQVPNSKGTNINNKSTMRMKWIEYPPPNTIAKIQTLV